MWNVKLGNGKPTISRDDNDRLGIGEHVDHFFDVGSSHRETFGRVWTLTARFLCTECQIDKLKEVALLD